MSTMYEEAIKMAEAAEAQIDRTIASLNGCECPVCEMIAATMEAAKRNMAEQRVELTQLTLDDPEGAAPLIAAGAVGMFSGYEATAVLMEKLSDEAHRAYSILRMNTLAGMGAVELHGSNLDEITDQIREKLAELGVPEDDDTPVPTQPLPKGWN